MEVEKNMNLLVDWFSLVDNLICQLFLSLMVVLIVVLIIMGYRHLPKNTINSTIRKKIKENGLIHFTTLDNAQKIKKEGLKPQNKELFFLEKNMVWLYMHEEEKIDSYKNIVQNKAGRDIYDCYIHFEGITDEQIDNMRYRKYDSAITHIGTFKTPSMPIIEL